MPQKKVSIGDYCHDLSEGTAHSIQFGHGHLPTVLKAHAYVWSRKLRLLTGVEQLVVLGHPRGLNRARVTNRQLSMLAGNTRTVQYLCVEIALLLSTIDFSAPFSPTVFTVAADRLTGQVFH